MIVLDASVMLAVLAGGSTGTSLIDHLGSTEQALHAPHLLDVEVLQTIRRLEMRGELDPWRGRSMVSSLVDFPLTRHSHDALAPRIWDLRHSLTAYDAAYVALAEALDASLLTRDRRLAMAHGHRARIEVV